MRMVPAPGMPAVAEKPFYVGKRAFYLYGKQGQMCIRDRFTDSAEASALVASLFFPFLIYQFGDGLQINFANALRGISDGYRV